MYLSGIFNAQTSPNGTKQQGEITNIPHKLGGSHHSRGFLFFKSEKLWKPQQREALWVGALTACVTAIIFIEGKCQHLPSSFWELNIDERDTIFPICKTGNPVPFEQSSGHCFSRFSPLQKRFTPTHTLGKDPQPDSDCLARTWTSSRCMPRSALTSPPPGTILCAAKQHMLPPSNPRRLLWVLIRPVTGTARF